MSELSPEEENRILNETKQRYSNAGMFGEIDDAMLLKGGVGVAVFFALIAIFMLMPGPGGDEVETKTAAEPVASPVSGKRIIRVYAPKELLERCKAFSDTDPWCGQLLFSCNGPALQSQQCLQNIKMAQEALGSQQWKPPF